MESLEKIFSQLDKLTDNNSTNPCAILPETNNNSLFAEQIERQQMRDVYKHYQQNIQRAGQGRNEILNGIRSGQEPLQLLLTACETISHMIGDGGGFAEQARQAARIIYNGTAAGSDTHSLVMIKQRIEKHR